MPLSSVSDFEHFERNIRKRIDAKIKALDEKAEAYLHRKKQEMLDESRLRLSELQRDWEEELSAHKEKLYAEVVDEIKRRWSRFKQQREDELIAALKRELGALFPQLALCFVEKVCSSYEDGTFSMPEFCAEGVDRRRFELVIWEKEEVVFRQEKLYIEYSVERIIEELGEEIGAALYLEENQWPAG